MFLGSLLPVSLLLPGILGFILWAGVGVSHNIYKLRKLGKRAPVVFSWTPFLGLDLIYQLLCSSRTFTTYDWWLSKCVEMGNTFEIMFLGHRFIFTAEPENIMALLSSQFNDFGHGEEFHQNWYPFLGDSIFVTDGEKWQHSRQLIRPQFIKERVSDLQTFEMHTQKLISIIKEAQGRTIDVQDLFFRLTLDITTRFLLGSSVDSLSTPQLEFVKAFGIVQQTHNDIEKLGWLHHFFPKTGYKESLEAMNRFVHQFVDKVVKMSPTELETKGSKHYNFLHELGNFTKDPKFLRDQIVAVLLAGRDTTACALSWALYELARHPEDVRKLRKEILDIVGPVEPPTYGNLKNMKYLQNIINEILRLYPSVPINLRCSLKDTTLPTGGGRDGKERLAILKGTPVGYGPIIVQRRSDLIGPDALEFKPERWEDWNPQPWTYIPFNAGPRICIGQQFAIAEMGYCLVRLFQVFEEVNYMDKEPQRIKVEITASVAGGVNLSFKEVAK